MAVPAMCKVTLCSLLLISSATSDCEVPQWAETPQDAALGTGLLQTKQGTKALEKTSFEDSVLKVMGKMEEELKELKNEDAGLKEELARLQKTAGNGQLAKVPRGRLDFPAIVAQHENASELRSSCRKASPLPPASALKANDSEIPNLQQRKSEQATGATCASGEVTLRDFQPAGVAETCCPRSKVACAGCASFTGGSSCQRCAEGFIEREGKCTACTNSGGWLSVDGKSCMQLAASDCSDEKVRGQSSNEACCQCGGGIVTPTPFSYSNSRWSLDSNIVMMPEPRTAERYTVDAKCELAAHNLTMDSSTGEISYMPGRAKPIEAFSFECEVTAHQAPGVSLASVVTIAADVLSYSSATLLFHSDNTKEVPQTSGAGWSKFELGCAPEVSWLSIAQSDGTLSYTAPSGANGGVSVADDKFFGQDGAVCMVTAWQAHKKHKTTFVAIRPRPWPKLEYDLEAVAVSLGEELHPLSPKPHKEQGLMKPWTFAMACDISGADGSTKFSYDRILNMGLIAGHPILDISSDGAITVAPAHTLSEVFDALSLADSRRKALTLSCRVFGIFPDPDLAPVEATLSIVVQDTVCWVPQHIKGTGMPDPSADTEAKCRSQCRADETCANYQFDSQCVRYDVRSDGNPVTVVAKVTNCTNEGTCMKVTHSDWFLAGTYCPLGRDAVLGGIVYLREHVTPQDMVYLREGSTGGCADGEWALLAPSSGDFMDKGLGLFELRGTRQACISGASVEHALRWCSTKELAWIEEQEEDEEGQPSLVLDDPGTTQLADYWLHPCDCAPDAWGPELPVDPQMYEHLPANSSNQFTPTPYVIVTGQLVCPSRQLLGGGNGVHFQSEEEVLEPADCEARCREQTTCLFFWHGSQHGAATCRLFTGCDNLVREFSLEGDLKVMPRSPSCSVADAAKCWATSLRRSFLSMAFSSDGGTSVRAAGSVGLNLPPKPAGPPSDGMFAWFESENAGSVWRSSVGDFEGYCSKNSVFRHVAAGYGADRPVTYIQGYTWSGFTFGDVLPPTHTVCSITRYTGSHRGRILQSKRGKNWLHGHWSNRVGVIHYNTWLTPKERNPNVQDWLVLCGTNGATRAFDGMSSGTPTNIATKAPKKFTETIPLYVNHGYDEKSDFAVMEVITWDRVLSEKEMLVTVDYLKWKLRAGAVLEASEHLATESQHNLDAWGVQDLNNMQSETTEVTFANGYKADLTGWTHTRYYARGFITNKNDVATAVVKGLTPAAQYLYQIYMVHEISNWQGEAKVSVNHGVQARAQQNGFNEAKFAGVAVASPRGEINFEFQRVSPHCQLSSIAIAKVGPSTVAKPADPPSQGMYAWFKSENAGSVWRSSVGDFEGYCSKNSVFRKVEAGYGADRPVTFIEGATGSGFTFGDVLPPTHSVCSISRYARGPDGSSSRGRILQSKRGKNWLHGHWSNRVGVIHYDTWVTSNERNPNVLDWLVLCGTNGATRAFDGMSSGTPTNIATKAPKKFTGTIPLYVNHGYDEKSDFAVMEVITWDRVLSEEEMLATVDYLKWKLSAGAVLEASEHLATESQHNLDAWGVQDLDNMQSKTTEVTFANGYKADLTGWTHTRYYARGFITNKNDVATAVVKGLTPAAQYLYQIYMVHEISNWQGEAKVSVNHGVQGRARQNGFNKAKFAGVAVASPRGEINFEFQRISPHCQLSGIAIAKVIGTAGLLQQATTAAAVQTQGFVSSGFLHLHLYQQCDAILLLGGMGVEQCGRPGHREIDSHDWQHKRPLPPAFQHGTLLTASCWSERYRVLRQNRLSDTEKMHCVNGDWYNSLGKPGLNGLACEACMQVGARGYAAYDERNEQELYFFNRMALSIYTELGMVKELDVHAKHKYCLQPSSDGNMTVKASSACPARLVAQATGWAGPQARLFKLLPVAEDAEQCLSTKGDTSGLMHTNCSATDSAQHLEPAELPTDMWDLHIEADERTQDLHKPFSSYCGTSGALSSLDFGQLFAGDTGTSQTACKFAPLIQFGEFVDTGIVRSKTTTNWRDWHHLLAENYVECASGEALTAFKLDAAKSIYKYECSKIGGLGACFDYYSAQVEIPSFSQSISHWAKPIRMMPVSCGQNAVLGSFHFEFSEGGKWGRVRYGCCKAGGAPVSFDPRGQLPELVGPYDGIYCPSSRDAHSGRVKFESGSGLTLSFERKSGQWCLDSECSEVTDSASPLGLKGAAFEVVNVSDFDGEFLGSMPKEKNKALSLAEALRMKPPRRPPQPPMPELEEFKAEQPKYAAECLNYENLWKDVSETFKDEEDEEVQTTSKLEADPSTKEQELDSYHPCQVAKTAGGIFGQWGGGDGSAAPENMMYADWNDCMQGDIERDLASAQLDYHSALTEFIMDLTEETLGAVCGVIPDVMIAPFGAGVALNPGEICDGISELVGAISNFAGPVSGFSFARQGWSIEQEGYAACNPMQVGFARAFCDIHCVRDAVIRGDRSIIRNLEMATKKTNNNLKALVKWSVDASHTDIGWIGEKLDYMHIINTAYMQEIHDMVTKQSQAAEEELVQGTERATDSMFTELAGYAQAASFDELSKITAKGALQDFLTSADFSPKANATAAASLLGRLDVLHQTLQRAGRGRDKSDMLSRQVAQTVRHLQRQASFHLRTLGVYRQESNASSHAARGKASKALARERHQVLMSLDHIWWQLRTKLDSYLDVAEDEVKAFQGSLVELKNYMDCKKGFSDLAAGYAQSMSALGRSHRHLRSTWRQGTNLLGELASVLADTEAFQGFVTEEGCKSELVKQTIQQLQSAIFGMAFLLHRFRAAKLPDPDTSGLKQATKRIQEAYAAATAKCH